MVGQVYLTSDEKPYYYIRISLSIAAALCIVLIFLVHKWWNHRKMRQRLRALEDVNSESLSRINVDMTADTFGYSRTMPKFKRITSMRKSFRRSFRWNPSEAPGPLTSNHRNRRANSTENLSPPRTPAVRKKPPLQRAISLSAVLVKQAESEL